MALLEVKQLTKHFGGLTAVGDVTLELNRGTGWTNRSKRSWENHSFQPLDRCL